MKKDEMYEIVSRPDLMIKYENVDVFYLKKGRYGLYKPAAKRFDEVRLADGRHPEQLFIYLSDRINILRQGTKKANRELKTALKAEGAKAKQAIHRILALTLSEPRSAILGDLTETIDIIVEEYVAHPDVMRNLALVSDKDFSTHTHLTNVMLFCVGYAHYRGFPPDEMKVFGLMGLLHDVGKVNIPDEILKAPRKLTDEEYEVVKKHPRDSWVMIKDCGFDERVPKGALEHHERLDGSGYPRKKKAEDLSSFSRALAIIDVFEALTTWRPYKDPMPVMTALAIIKEEVAAGKLDGDIFAHFAYSIVRKESKKQATNRKLAN